MQTVQLHVQTVYLHMQLNRLHVPSDCLDMQMDRLHVQTVHLHVRSACLHVLTARRPRCAGGCREPRQGLGRPTGNPCCLFCVTFAYVLGQQQHTA